MATIGQLQIEMSAKIDKLERDLKKARGEIARASNQIKRMSDDSRRSSQNIVNSFSRMSIGATGLRTRLVATSRAMHAFLAIAAGGIAASFVARTISATDALGKMAARLSVSAEFLQEMRFAASQSGVTLQTLELGMQRIIRRAQDAASGNKQLENAFYRVGLRVEDLRRLSNEEIFRRAIIGAANLKDGLFALQQIADTEGVALINLGRAGASGLGALQRRARDLGLVLSNETVKAAEDANDRLDIMQRVLSVQLTRAVLKLSPHITQLGESFARIVSALVDTNKGFHNLTANENQIVKTLQAIGNAAATAWGYLMQVGDVLGRLAVRFTMTTLTERMQQLNKEIADLQKNIEQIESKQVGGAPQSGIFPNITIREPGQNLELMQNRLKNLLAEREVIQKEMARQTEEGLLEGLRRAATQIEQQVRQISTRVQTPSGKDPGFGDTATEAEAKAAITRLRQRQAEIQALNDQRLADEQEQADKFREIQNRLFSDMEKRAEQLTSQFQLPVEAFVKQREELESLRDASLISQGTFERAMTAAEQAYKRTTVAGRILQGVGQGIADAFSTAIDGVIQGTQTVGEAFKNMFRSILLSIGKLLVQFAVMQAVLIALSAIPGGTAVLKAMDAAALASSIGQGATAAIQANQGTQSSSIGGLQHGGIINRPTLAMLGENPAHNPEYVLNRQQMEAMQEEIDRSQKQAADVEKVTEKETVRIDRIMQNGGIITKPTTILLGENPAKNPEYVRNRQQMEAMQLPISKAKEDADVAKKAGGNKFIKVDAFMQNGGVVNKPTIAMLGENPSRNPEYVLNRQQMRALMVTHAVRQQAQTEMPDVHMPSVEEIEQIIKKTRTDIEAFENGGIVRRPTLALMGENQSKNPEYKFNRHQMESMSGNIQKADSMARMPKEMAETTVKVILGASADLDKYNKSRAQATQKLNEQFAKVDAPQMPIPMQNGGIVFRPTLTLMGENPQKNPEFILTQRHMEMLDQVINKSVMNARKNLAVADDMSEDTNMEVDSLLSLRGIQQAQQGAVINRPQLILAGENPANNPEFILNRQQMEFLQENRIIKPENQQQSLPPIILVDDRNQAEQLAAQLPGAVIRIVSEQLLGGTDTTLHSALGKRYRRF